MRKATALAAFWVAVLFAALLPTAAASAAPTKCVGLVVDSGQSTKTACVSYQSGMTGADLLKKTGHKVAYQSNGLLCQIDGYPKACKSDKTHYWSYYIRKPGSTNWTYALKGPVTEKVQPRETDEFLYLNGNTKLKPKAVPYATLAKSDTKAAAGKKSDSGGSNTGLIVGIVVAVVIVVAAAGTFAMRRRRAA